MHVEPTRGEPNIQVPTITCVLPMSQAVYTGDEEGRVVSFRTPSTEDVTSLLIMLLFSMSGIVCKDRELVLLLAGDETQKHRVKM